MKVVCVLALAACHVAHRGSGSSVGNAVAPVPPMTRPPPPFPALRAEAVAPPAIAIAAGPTRTVGKCTYETRVPVDAKVVDRQLVIHCGLARAIEMASGNGEVMFTLSSQTGNEPMGRIARDGELVLAPPSATSSVRFERGAFEFGPPLPPGAPPPPPGWSVLDGDDSTIFATGFDQGLMRGTLERAVWKFAPAFAMRMPPRGSLFAPVFLHHLHGDPTIAYLTDPHDQIDLTARLPNGALVGVPPWGRGTPGQSRVSKLSAIEVPEEPVPVIAAKVDDSIVVAYPSGPEGFSTRAMVGIPQFGALPATGSTVPTPSPRGPRCSEVLAMRDRDELYDPQLFAWHGANLAYLANRVHEELRWTVVPGKRAICDWHVDRRTGGKQLVLMHLDRATATEVARIPVDYTAGDAALIVGVEGDMLHAIATSSGIVTYTRVALTARE